MDITCQTCGDVRPNVRQKHTKFCERCRLLDNLLFVGERTRSCALCSSRFAPASRGDQHCGDHAFGANVDGRCNVCGGDAVELHRASIRLCKSCLRDPALRHKLVRDLKASQRRRIAANQGRA